MSIEVLFKEEGDKLIFSADFGTEPLFPEDAGYGNPRTHPLYDKMIAELRNRGYLNESGVAMGKFNLERGLKDDHGHYSMTLVVKLDKVSFN
ncbi:MAG: hypothetical protein AABX96_02085 [Nanoarchaeota archaeon]